MNTPLGFQFDPRVPPQAIYTNSLSPVAITLQESLYSWSRLYCGHQLSQSRVILQPFAVIQGQLLVMADLVNDNIRIRDSLPKDEWSVSRQLA